MSAPPPPTAPPPPHTDGADTGAAPGSSPRRLTRHRRGRLVGGVAAGLGRYLGVDRVVVRIGFVVLAFVPFPGFGVLLYIAMLLLVPEEDADGAVVPTRLTERTPAFWIGVGLVGLATFALLGVIGDGRTLGLVPLLLIGLGVALWVDADRRPSAPSTESRGRPSSPTASSAGTDWQPPAASSVPVWEVAAPGAPRDDEPGPAGADTATWRATDAGTSPGSGAATWRATDAATRPSSDEAVWTGAGSAGAAAPPAQPPAPSGPAWTPPPVPRRARSPLGRITVGLALLAGGAAWAVDLLDLVEVPLSSMLAVVLLVLGLGLLVGSLYGRARWLVAVVALLLPTTLAAVAIEDLGIDLRGGFDEREVLVTDAAQLDGPVTIAAGSLELDLRDLPAGEDVTVDASVGAGELIVLVPEGAGLTGDVRMEVGEVVLLDDRSTGVSVRRSITEAAEPGQPTIDLDLRVGAGELRVQAVPPSEVTGDPDPATDATTDDATPTEVQP